MALLFQGTGGLFTRIGQIGQVVADIQALVGNGNTLPTDVTNLLNQYEGSGLSNAEADLVGGVPAVANAARLAITSLDTALQQVAVQTLGRMVFRDNPVSSRSNPVTNLTELIRQMLATGDTVKQCVISATSASISGYTNTGNGALVLSTKRGDGLVQENAFAETARLICVGDAQGGGTAGSESFQFQGTEAQTNPFHYEWPLGSGATANIQSVDATKSNSGNNLLNNSSWTTVSSNVPTNWVATLGLAGTDIFSTTSGVYGSDTNAIYFFGGTGHVPELTQKFNVSSAGTAGALKADSVYHFAVAMKANTTPNSGVLTFDLIDQNGAVYADDQGTVNSFSVNANTITTAYQFFTGTFRTPKVLPATTRIRYRVSSPLPGGNYKIYLAHSSLAIVSPLYTGGLNLSLHGGSSNWIKGDKFNVTVTNNRGGATAQKTFQTLFDRLFSMRLNNLLLPSSSSPTIPDSLI